MSANRLRLDQLRRMYRELVEAHEYEEAVEILIQVGNLYHHMASNDEVVPPHFLDPGDDLL